MANKKVEILLCEDNKRDADLTMRALKRQKLANSMVWVRDGEEALNYIFGEGEYKNRSVKDAPRVILLDIKMPKVDGMEVLQKVRSHPDTKHIPVVMMTSSQEEKDIIKSYDLGANSYIVKPVDFNKFMDSVSDVGFYWLLLNKPPNNL